MGWAALPLSIKLTPPLPPSNSETPFINGGKVFAAVVSAWDDDGTQVGGRTSWVALLLCQSEL